MSLAANPVTARELRERFRGLRSPIFFTVWLLVVMGLGYLIYLLARTVAGSQGFFGAGLLTSASMGTFILEALLLMLLTAVGLIVPGVASLGIVGERDRQTMHLLQVSQLSAWQIVIGKLASSLAYLLLLIVAVSPLLVLPVLFGGVTIMDVFVGLAIIALTAVALGAISTSFSARARTARGAVAASYSASFFLGAGTALLILLEVVFFPAADSGYFGPDGREVYSMWLNPYVGLVSALDEPGGLRSSGFTTPFDAVDELLQRRQSGSLASDFGFIEAPGFDGDIIFEEGAIGIDRFGQQIIGGRQGNRGSIWVRMVLVYIAIIALALWRATSAVRAPPVTRRRRRGHANAVT